MLIAASLLFAAAAVQEPAFTPDVRAAERAFSDALQRHDRAAFERLIAPDAIFYLPTVLEGRDAITMGWIPFLAINGSVLNIEPGSVSGQGDLLVTEGRYSIGGTGPIRPAGRPLPRGLKRGTDGWTVCFRRRGSAPRPANGCRRLRMMGGGRLSLDDEAAGPPDSACDRTDVPSTGGFEPELTFEGRKMNVSFVFQNNALRMVTSGTTRTSEKDAKATDAVLSIDARPASSVRLASGAAVTSDDREGAEEADAMGLSRRTSDRDGIDAQA